MILIENRKFIGSIGQGRIADLQNYHVSFWFRNNRVERKVKLFRSFILQIFLNLAASPFIFLTIACLLPYFLPEVTSRKQPTSFL